MSLLIIMPGTSDSKERFGMNAFAIGLGMRRPDWCHATVSRLFDQESSF